jgi:acetoin utilization deacetylase AcuC-like enzyme
VSTTRDGDDPDTEPDRDLWLAYDERTLAHRHPDGAFDLGPDDALAVAEPHPERPARLENVHERLVAAFDPPVERPTPADRATLERVHEPDYLDDLDARAADEPWLTPTTRLSRTALECGAIAAGGAVAAARRALDAGDLGYALVRPPGHHAQPGRADGYCYYSNAAVAAADALATGRADRVAVLDWDVHHGNGTQAALADRADALAVSLHNDFGAWGESHPQTGGLEERGTGAGAGYTINVPLPAGTGATGYADAFDRVVEPAVAAYDPDLLLVAAGADPGSVDPNGRNLLTAADFRDLGARARRLADGADAALAITQEGGYALSQLSDAALAWTAGALGAEVTLPDRFQCPATEPAAARSWIDDAVAAHAADWPVG